MINRRRIEQDGADRTLVEMHVSEQLAAALELFPIFADARVLRTWAGVVDVCPDASPIVGPTPVEGLYVNCGWGTGGFKATPGSGWAFAWTLAHEEPQVAGKRRVAIVD